MRYNQSILNFFPAAHLPSVSMNLDLESRLKACGSIHSRLTKSEKVKLLARWTAEFPDLLASARRGQASPSVARDNEADLLYGAQRDVDIYVLPDDKSAMPSYFCKVDTMPDLQELVSDTITSCDELVVISADFAWSAVFVNHGSPQFVGRHFQVRRAPA
jgi:hypothetical protein